MAVATSPGWNIVFWNCPNCFLPDMMKLNANKCSSPLLLVLVSSGWDTLAIRTK